MRLSIETTDGTVYESKASDRTWMCAADRFKFERHFNVSTIALQAWQEASPEEDEDGDAVLTLTSVSEEALKLMREEHLLFFVHRELHRQVEGGLPSFEEIRDDVVSYDLDLSDEEGGADPSPEQATPAAS